MPSMNKIPLTTHCSAPRLYRGRLEKRIMKKTLLFVAAFLLLTGITALPTCCLSQANQVLYTLEDRDRSIRMEEKIVSLEKSVNTRFESIDDKLDKLYTLIYFVLGGVFGLIGLVFWDRRSYIKPVKEDIRELQNALKDFAKEQPKLADILRSHGLM